MFVSLCLYMISFLYRLDGPMPDGVDIVNNTFRFTRPLEKNDSGLYRCEVYNDIGPRSHDVHVWIQGERVWPSLNPSNRVLPPWHQRRKEQHKHTLSAPKVQTIVVMTTLDICDKRGSVSRCLFLGTQYALICNNMPACQWDHSVQTFSPFLFILFVVQGYLSGLDTMNCIQIQ